MAEARLQRRRRWRVFWPLIAVGGLLAGAASVWYQHDRTASARGKHRGLPDPQAVAAGHEVKDINVRNTVFILAGMAGATALVIGIVFVMVWRFDVQRRAAFADLTAEQRATPIPPAPRLQVDPFADLAQVQAREQYLLHSYGWTSADHSTARIPIDRAMALSVGKSLDAGP